MNKTALRHMMLNEDTLADEFDAILGYRTSHAGLVLAGDYTAEEVREGAGAPAGSYGLISGSTVGAITNYSPDMTPISTSQVITNEAEAAALSSSGTGTEADPYVITQTWYYQVRFTTDGDTDPAITWDHDHATYPSEVYWIRFYDCRFGYVNSNAQTNRCGDARIDAPTGGGAIFENCTFGAALAADAGNPLHIEAVNGTTRLINCWWHRAVPTGSPIGHLITKSGADAILELTNTLVRHTTLGTEITTPPTLFKNAAAGGSLTINRMAVDTRRAATSLLLTDADWTVSINGLHWDSADWGGHTVRAIDMATYQAANWDSGLTVTNSYFNAGTGTTLIGSAGTTLRIRNVSFDHCTFWAADGEAVGGHLLDLGDNTAAEGEFINLSVTWCRFRRPLANTTPSNEVMYLRRFSNLEIAYCWVDQCGEDAYEILQPYTNNSVHHCGGGDVEGSYVNGNIVDIWGGSVSGSWADGGLVEVNNIWGTCKGDAVFADACENINIHSIYTDNSGGPGPYATTSNVRIKCGTQNGSDNVTVSAPLPTPAQSYHGNPCLLDYHPSATIALNGAHAGGLDQLTVNAITIGQWAAGQQICVLLNDGTYHDTTIDGTPPDTTHINITDALPGAAGTAVDPSTSRNVFTTTITSAGTVVWPGGDGTDGVVRPHG